MACTIPTLLFCCLLLLLVPRLGTSYRTSYTDGGNQHAVLRSPDDDASPTTFCSNHIPSGDDGGITAPLPVFHRLSLCSPHAGAGSRSQGKPSAADVLRRDTLGLQSLLSAESNSAKDAVTVPTTGSAYVDYPSASEYHVVVGYGTPVQRFTLGFDTVNFGVSQLACKPCGAGVPCYKAFDISKSSSLAQIPCNSPDCPLSQCSVTRNPSCMASVSRNGRLWYNTTIVTDKLTLSGAMGMDKFRFACMEMFAGVSTTVDDTPYGILDLSQDRHSLASRAPLSANTVAFSYCLPSRLTTHGFLSIAAARPELSGRSVSYTAMRTNAARRNQYLVQLTGITVGGKNIPVPPARLAGDSLVALRTTFTYLRPDIYAVLREEDREEFVGEMKRHNHFHHRRVAPVGALDTCYNFAGLLSFIMPSIKFEFDGALPEKMSLP